ncbi:MAG: hypothetical protein FJW38_02515 [Acidobacteria bacterium]|nr:hypothetical protein [Acidobacteriota bacterium]
MLAAPAGKMVKITAIKALQLDNVGDGCLIRVHTDAGISGYGEAGLSASMARAHRTFERATNRPSSACST